MINVCYEVCDIPYWARAKSLMTGCRGIMCMHANKCDVDVFYFVYLLGNRERSRCSRVEW